MNTADIIDAVASKDDKLTKAQAKAIVDGVFTAIRDAAVKGEEVSIPGFGKFKVQNKPARTGRNPQSGDKIKIKASKTVTFKPTPKFKSGL